ncbi:MAG: class I SAM-dependent methyltransferase [Candidatus Neomarinimicrobiota bacterium]
MVDVKKLYREGADFQFEHDEILLGAPSSYSLTHDPKHLAFVLSRYKFVAKMLAGKKRVLELGCGDGIGIPLIAQVAEKLYCVDWEQRPLDSIQRRLGKYFLNLSTVCADVTKDKLDIPVDAIFSIDFLEHIDPNHEKVVMEKTVANLPADGVLITGTPNITASQYASPCSAVQHINLKSMDSLKELMETWFNNVFMFGMNDEVLHTGYGPMSHYIWSIAVGPRK